MKRFITTAFLLAFAVLASPAQSASPDVPAGQGRNLSLAQIDASGLLPRQLIRVYVSVTDSQGVPLEDLPADAFTIFESADGREFKAIEGLHSFTARAGSREGINFLLIMDNSGSMYDTLGGRTTEDDALRRITAAKEAVRTFLGGMSGSRDTAGLVSYNTGYVSHARPRRDTMQIAALLDDIRRPTPEEAYTELYAALSQAVREFEGIRGRRAIVILSDGENYPYVLHSGKPHPVYADRIFAYTEPIRLCQEEGISVYAINFGAEKDRNLEAIALETGGAVFDASDREELAGVYDAIRRRVAGEYLLTYRATMSPADRKYVRVRAQAAGADLTATRFYFAASVFGPPLPALTPLLAVPFLLALLLFWLITRLRFEKKQGPASLEVLATQVGRAATRVLPIKGAQTVIGGSARADLTIVGNARIKEQHATIVFDDKKKRYTLVGSGTVTVNNRPVKTKILEAGDVLNVEGATIVFDDGRVP
jgi:Ca-activated chloride channel family protein